MSKQDEHIENKAIEPIDLTVIIRDILNIVKKKIIQLILIVVVCTGVFMVYQKLMYKPYYTAYQTFIVSASKDINDTGSYYDKSAAEQFAKTFPYILKSDILQKKVAKALDMSYVPGTIKAEVMENTNFLTISVTDDEPKRAHDTLMVVIETYPEISESIIGKIFTELMDENGIPGSPDNVFSIKATALKGAFMGCLICLVWVVLIILTNKTIRGEEDCIKKLNSKCIGKVVRVKEKARSRKTEYRPSVMEKNIDEGFVENFRIIRNKIEYESKHNKSKVFLITSSLPGEGKSTIATNVALSLMKDDKKVALVDCDLRNPSDGMILNAPIGKGLIDFLKGEAKFTECIVNGKDLFDYKYPFVFVRGGKKVDDGSKYLASERMLKAVSALEKQADYVIIDSAPVGLLTDAAILAQYADTAIFVVKNDFAKSNKIMESMEHLNEANVKILGCILNGAED